MDALLGQAKLPEERHARFLQLIEDIRQLKIEIPKALKELDAITGQRPTAEFLATGEYDARMQQEREKVEQHELALFDIKTARKEKYANYLAIWYSKEEMEEKARMDRQRKRLAIEKGFMTKRQEEILIRMNAIQARLVTETDPTKRRELVQEDVNLAAEYAEKQRLMELNAEQVKALQQTKREAANQEIRDHMKTRKYLEAAKETWAFYGDTLINYTGQMVEAWKNMFEQMGQASKTAWDVYKGLAIAQTIVSGIQLAWEGAKALAGIPYVGPALAGAWIAAIAAQTAVQVKTIEGQKPASYAQGGVIYGDIVAMDRKRAKSASYASGGVTSGAATAIIGDNPSGAELVIPAESIDRDKTSGYTRKKGGDGNINVINLVTQEDIAAAMNTKIGGAVIINKIGQDMNARKSTYRKVKETNRRR